MNQPIAPKASERVIRQIAYDLLIEKQSNGKLGCFAVNLLNRLEGIVGSFDQPSTPDEFEKKAK